MAWHTSIATTALSSIGSMPLFMHTTIWLDDIQAPCPSLVPSSLVNATTFEKWASPRRGICVDRSKTQRKRQCPRVPNHAARKTSCFSGRHFCARWLATRPVRGRVGSNHSQRMRVQRS
ncbi:hypothetical protein H257_08054 [Aphanomyces astaci]|uniref:Uncharacterized protein n=1 Tax=Aphanomyces astaci TaxID=112090 RepID=W4GHP1_APHAT|nr:hypothetical protein H257_08054 [Aphanomyces astaci]ETV78544.1 hypothetical protein H257_08054 [Aphanomyces astaci]|eukprot:XP_009832125.1 hypothetical protein H257_08054 [Aphanomyces astaci]